MRDKYLLPFYGLPFHSVNEIFSYYNSNRIFSHIVFKSFISPLPCIPMILLGLIQCGIVFKFTLSPYGSLTDPRPFCKVIFSLLLCTVNFVINKYPYMHGSILNSSFAPLVCLSFCFCSVSHCLNHGSFTESLAT